MTGSRSTRTISIVVPTLERPAEVGELLANLEAQTLEPLEVIVVDGAASGDERTRDVVDAYRATGSGITVRYRRSPRGTAVQRNAGIEMAAGAFIAFIDDDVRLDPTFLEEAVKAFESPVAGAGDRPVGGVVGYRTTSWLDPDRTPRWRWYRRLRLLTTFEPGAYDWATGYPINANLQPPFSGVRPVEFMTTACAVWRRDVFADGLRFDQFFRDYGVLEDAHLALRAGRSWALLQCGDARCQELRAAGGRVSTRRIAYKSVVNYWYVFQSVAGPLSPSQRWRFWRMQAFEAARVVGYGAVHPGRGTLDDLLGRLEGVVAVLRGAARTDPAE